MKLFKYILLGCLLGFLISINAYPSGMQIISDVATDVIWDAAGDLVQGTGAKLTKGAEGTILRAGAVSNAYSTSTFADTYAIGTILHAGTANIITGLTAGTSGYLLRGNGAAAPSWTNSLTGISIIGAFTTYTGVPTVSTITTGVLTQDFAALLPDAADGASLGNATYEWSDLYLADGGVIYYQNDQSVYLTPSASTLTLTGNFVASGTISGQMPIVVDGAASPYNISVAQAKAGTFFLNTLAGTKVYNLPAAEAGMAVCVKNGQGVAQILQVDTDGTDYIVKSTGARTSLAGDYYGATADAKNQICLVCFDATDWYVTSEVGTWTEE